MTDVLFALGDVSLLEGELDEAAGMYLRAFRTARGLGHEKNLARGLRGLGIIASRQDCPELGARRFGA
ncbi:MAG TPA: hypothetical protein VJN70_18440, partial [Gemmatimonadaceae bacterium]|nr:hypothetical protein [Gemmatimonadaceae bacterium]